MSIRRLREHSRASEQDAINHVEDKIIYAWPVKTMTNRQNFGGKAVVYEVVMYEDGFLYCNCAGWQFAKVPKTCKHCRHVETEAQQRYNEYKHGDFSNFQVIEEEVTIPTVNPALRRTRVTAVPGNVPPPAPEQSTNPNIRRRYGRVIEC